MKDDLERVRSLISQLDDIRKEIQKIKTDRINKKEISERCKESIDFYFAEIRVGLENIEIGRASCRERV